MHTWYYTRYEERGGPFGMIDDSDQALQSEPAAAISQEESITTICDLPFKEEMWRHIPELILDCLGIHWRINAFATAGKATHAWYYSRFDPTFADMWAKILNNERRWHSIANGMLDRERRQYVSVVKAMKANLEGERVESAKLKLSELS